MNYADLFYIPALDSSRKLSQDNFEPTRKISVWLDRMSRNWDSIAIKNVEIPVAESELHVGQKLPITIDVNLGEISPDDVRIELVSGRLNAQEQITNFVPIVLSQQPAKKDNQNGVYSFSGEVTLAESGRFGIAARVIPKSDTLPHTIRPKLISWW